MTREELLKQKAQEFASKGEFSPTLTECFIAGVESENKRLVEKACEWLEDNFMNLILGKTRSVYAGGNFATVDEMIADFRKAMEE